MGASDHTNNPEPFFGDMSSDTLASDKSSGLHYYKPESKLWKIIGVMSLIVAAISMVLAVTGFLQTRYLVGAGPLSCQYVSGPTGVYYIKSDYYFDRYAVYCDMDTDGGGWTLVAAVHENDITGKCTVGDKWSSEQGLVSRLDYNGSENWENKNIFGTVNSLTNDDYKNIGYYGLKASNVMIWHVPNLLTVGEFSSKAFLKYYTTDNFLLKFGGNLQSLYSNHAPMVHAGPGRFFQLIASPVTYALGNNDTVLSGIPVNQRQFVQPGYIQFRAFDISGNPNALCPGVRMTQGNSAKVCVGSSGLPSGPYLSRRRSNCGDFAGWNGDANDPGNATDPSLSGRSQNDINSSIFIFVR